MSCGGAAVDPTATPTVPPSPTPLSATAILENSIAAMEELESYHFEMVMQMTFDSQGTTMEVPMTFIGDFKMPDRLRGEMTMEMFGSTIETEVIIIGETSYVKDPSSGEWQISSESATPFTPEDFIGLDQDDLADIENLLLLGEEDLDGVSAYHMTGKLPAEVLRAVLGEAEGDVKLAYWIGIEDGWMRQVDIEMKLFEEGGDPEEINATISLKFSEFNKEIIIEAP
ncbi:MAG TPA: LppX_LprAFG lipoprotein [Anaerolineae bacterium]|nr:LppX_LprAFG lipoprotein [Anaerolineae bacterium]